MKNIETVKVTFHRTYEVPIEDIYDNLLLHIDDIREEDIVYEAERIATNWFIEEAPEFLDDIEDFVSNTIEIIRKYDKNN